MTKPMTAADELRPYLNADPRPEHVGCGVVMQLLAEHDEQRDRADEAEAELAEVRTWMADPFNQVRIAPVVKRAYRQRDEAVEEAAAALEEYKADLTAAHAELAELRAQMAAVPAPFRFGSQWSVRYLEDGIVTEKYHTEAEARQRAKANPRTLELVTRFVESEWRTVGGDDA